MREVARELSEEGAKGSAGHQDICTDQMKQVQIHVGGRLVYVVQLWEKKADQNALERLKE